MLDSYTFNQIRIRRARMDYKSEYNRWLEKRLTTVNILDRLEAFDEEALLLSNMF